MCNDKTGTLTKNELAIKDPKILPGWELKYIYLNETLACRKHEVQDPIDLWIT